MSAASGVGPTVGEVPEAVRPNYSGAIYGSLLAASVAVGAGAGGEFGLGPFRLAVLLVVTGLVFWLAHAYARLVGGRTRHAVLDRAEIGRVARHEWPLLQAAFPPAGAALLAGLLGAGNAVATWSALVVAITAQVGWATVASVRAGANGPLVFTSALVNLVLGLLIVALKSALHH